MHLSIQWVDIEMLRASQAGKVEYVRMLLDSGVQVNMQNDASAV